MDPSKRTGLLEGKVLFVAGAGPKMGGATAKIGAREGAKAVLVARTSERNDELAQSIRDAGGSALPLTCDFRDRSQLETAVDAALREYGRIDSRSDRASIITGEIIHLDGGQFARAHWPSVRPHQ